MEPLAPVYTAGLFAPLQAELIALLRGLGAEDWGRPTVARAWTVRDVAAHLLDVDLRKLSGDRDGHRPTDRPVSSYDEIVALIDHLNATGVAYAARLGPRLITDLLDVTGTWVSEFVLTLDPHRPARLAVAWAGEAVSENWMDTGREYTERWHHQMQIRDAVGAPGLLARRWAHPVFELSVRAFGRAYAPVAADEGTAVVFEVDGESGGVWSVVREHRAWRVLQGAARDPAARVRTDPDTAWRLLFNALPSEAAPARVQATGDVALVTPLLGARAVMVPAAASARHVELGQ